MDERQGQADSKQINVDPPENVVYEPIGLTTKRIGTDAWLVQYLISPFKMITIQLSTEAKAELLKQLSGGIVIPV